MILEPIDIGVVASWMRAAHGDQKRVDGSPYWEHPQRVGTRLAELRCSADVIAAGLLHDVIEDTHFDKDGIEARFGERVAALCQILTHLPDEPYDDYVTRVAEDRDAALIKRCDMLDNLDETQLARLPTETADRFRRKYTAGLDILNARRD